MDSSSNYAILTRGELTVKPNDCPKCPYRMRISPDAKTAFINISRVSKTDYPKMAQRAFSLMEKAADAKTGGVQRPLMGWSSWNTYRVNISEDIIIGVAETMAANGLRDAGFRYVNIDDGFFHGRDESGKLRVNPVRFPRGLKPVVDRIHALGMKAGIYSDAGSDTCGSLCDNDIGGHGAGFFGHDDQDAEFYFREMDFDFIKIDFCGGERQNLDPQERYTAIRHAIDRVKPGVRMNICRWTFPGEWARRVAESWRTTGDIQANWPSVKQIIDENIPLTPFMSLGHYNDMDMMEVGHIVGKTKTVAAYDTGLEYEEQQTHFGLWCFFSSPLLIGSDVRQIDDITLALLTNPFLIGMNQNDLGAQPRVVLRAGETYILVKDCDTANGPSRYLALYNASDEPHAFNAGFYKLDLAGKVAIFDLLERADLGEFEEKFEFTVPRHGARFFRLDAEKRR